MTAITFPPQTTLHDVELRPLQRQLLGHWEELPRTVHPLVPTKSLLEPRRLASLSSHLGMAEYISRYEMLIRFVGTEIDALETGVNWTGVNAFDFYEPEPREAFAELWANLFETPCAVLGINFLDMPRGRIAEQHCLHLPLCDAAGQVRHVVSTFEYVDVRLGETHDSKKVFRSLRNFGHSKYLDIGAGTPPLQEAP